MRAYSNWIIWDALLLIHGNFHNLFPPCPCFLVYTCMKKNSRSHFKTWDSTMSDIVENLIIETSKRSLPREGLASSHPLFVFQARDEMMKKYFSSQSSMMRALIERHQKRVSFSQSTKYISLVNKSAKTMIVRSRVHTVFWGVRREKKDNLCFQSGQ